MTPWFKHFGRMAVVVSMFSIGFAFTGGCENEEEVETPAGEIEVEE